MGLLFGVPASYAMNSEERQNNFVRVAAEGDLARVKQSLQDLADIDLILAADKGDLARVKQSLQDGADIDGLSCSSDPKLTALITAAFAGKHKVVEFLLQQGAAVSKPDTKGITALHVAALENHFDIVKLLLEHGADVNAQGGDVGGESVLMWALMRASFSPKPETSAQGNFDDLFVSLYNFNCEMATARLNIVNHLLVAGCDYKIKDKEGKTAYDCAKGEKIKEILADPNEYMQKHPEEFEAARTWYRNWQQKAQEKSCYCCGKNEQDALQEKLSRCSQCKKALYCSRTCQSKDWKKHKQNCKPKKQEEKKQERTCCYCGKSEQESAQKKLSRCSQCKKALYCDRSCQSSGWKTHKENCNK